ncbi:MAG: Sensor histidine kinase RcsC [Verrucomicrobiae bacterium]|nr:Sensor histidine kinase RcsC [Verrucomicrobiae bacterium]
MNFDNYKVLVTAAMDFSFPPEWVKAALVLSFFSTWVVIGVFWYLNRLTKKTYFSLWTISWMFFSVWLAASIQLEETPDQPLLMMVRRACIGVCALFMFWGSFEMTGSMRRSRRELGLGILLTLVWSYTAAYVVKDQPWITVPVFALFGAASLYTGRLYLRMRSRYRGASMLATGFMLFGVQLFCRPFIEDGTALALTCNYVITSILAVFIALGMIVQTLEQGREQNDTLVEEFKRGMTVRRLLEQEVTVSEQKYRALFDSATDALFLVDLETLKILEYNLAAATFVGDKPSDGIDRSFLDLCPSLRGISRNSLLDNKRMFDEVFGDSHEFTMLRPDGSQAPCEGTATLVQYNRRSVLQLDIREITERKRLEQQLRQSEKLSALGQLTAGVAHELNNPLAVIMGYSQVLAKQTESNPKLKGDIIKILRESERAAKIVRNLLTFARPREPQMLTVDINRLIANILEAYETEFENAMVHVQTALAPDLPRTVADPHQIEQVLANLVINAIQAMGNSTAGRSLTVGTEVCERMIRVTISDTGPGIAPEVVSKIFDPFYTTKSPGKGTGLGLSISHSIIHEHRGRIWVQSELGHGATFVIELPLIARTIEEQLAENPVVPAAPVADPAAGSYRLLIVDDEPGIVEVLHAIFTGCGYMVDTANNGNEALEKIADHHYNLIISDLCMPGVDGEELYRKVKALDSELAAHIIFVTGDTVSNKSRSFLEWTGNRWFSKPFNIRELEEVVANFLKQNETAPVA